MDILTPTHTEAHQLISLPDLVLVGSKKQWLISNISDRLASTLGVDPYSKRGLLVDALFKDATPSISSLVDEVFEREPEKLERTIRLHLGKGLLCAVTIEAGGMSDDFTSRYVNLTFNVAKRNEDHPETITGLVGNSGAMRELYRKIKLYAPTEASVVITGETGTGKEVIASSLHQMSSRNAASYVAVNCSAISEELLESELFGHEKGAFTGAMKNHRGHFERADGGTIFLDEIGEMPLHTQSKLLRVLEEGRILRVGAEVEREIDVRVICATNIPLERSVGEKSFRMDLYHRLSVLRIHVPPLRERLDDIPLLVDHFLDKFNTIYNKDVVRLTPEAITLLQSYLWPGNIRELRNVIERIFVETECEVINARAFEEWIHERQEFAIGEWGLNTISQQPVIFGQPQPIALLQAPASSTKPSPLTKETIRSAYLKSDGNIAAAARLLGVHRATLYRHMKKLDIDREDM